MDIYIANPSLQLLGIVDYCESIIWHTCYCGAGDFDISVPATEQAISLFAKDNFIYTKNSDRIMLIEKVELSTNIEEGDHLIVTGTSGENIIGRRIVWEQTTLSGATASCARQLINDNIINSTIGGRNISILSLGETIDGTPNIRKQITGDNLLDSVVSVLSSNGLGFRVSYEISRVGGRLYFDIMNGSDRSGGNVYGNPVVKFSPEFDNLLNSDYSLDCSTYKNVARIAGEGEGTARTYTQTGTAGGLERFEVFVDARDISSNDGAISADDYEAMLVEKGEETLIEHAIIESFTGEIEPNTTYSFNRDFFIGDIVQIENQYGISARVRITDVTEKIDNDGYNIVLSYANV